MRLNPSFRSLARPLAPPLQRLRPAPSPLVQQAGRRLHLEVALVLRRLLRKSIAEPTLARGRHYLGEILTLKAQGLTGPAHLHILNLIRTELEIRLGFPALATPYVEFDVLRDRVVEIIRFIEALGQDFSRRLDPKKFRPGTVVVEPFSQKAFRTMSIDDIFLVTAAQVFNRIEKILINDLSHIHLNPSMPLIGRGVAGDTFDHFLSHLFFHFGIVFPYKYPNGKPTIKPTNTSFDLVPVIRNLLRDQVRAARKAVREDEKIYLVRFPMTEGTGTIFIWVVSTLDKDWVTHAFDQLYRPHDGFAYYLHQALEDAAPYGILRLGARSAHEWGKFQVRQKPMVIFRPDGSRLL